MGVEYWLGVLTPFVIILAVGLLCLLLVGVRWFNRRAAKHKAEAALRAAHDA